MADSINHWIALVVEEELTTVAESCGSNATQSFQKHKSSCNTFKLHLQKERHVQLVECLSKKAPCIAWVSDSHTQIRVIFTPKATDAFRKSNARPITSMGGAILSITDYYLTFNLNDGNSKKIMLIIEESHLIGSEGSGTFGQPVRIEDHEIIKSLMLRVVPAQNNHEAEEDLEIMSQAGSNAGSISEERLSYSNYTTTQAPFATQVISNTLAETNAGRQSEPQNKSPTQYPLKKSTSSNYNDHNAQLLATLNERGNKGNLKAGKEISSILPQMTTDAAPLDFPDAPHELVDEKLVVKEKWNFQSKVSVQGSQNMMPLLDSKDVLDLPGTTLQMEHVLNHVQKHSDGLSDDNEKENGQERVKMVTESSNSKIITTKELIEDHISSQESSSADIWVGYSRIPRKYVQVPKEQRALLDREESWHTANDSECVNVPPKDLIKLQTFHERQIFLESGIGQEPQPVKLHNALQSENAVHNNDTEKMILSMTGAEYISSRHSEKFLPQPALKSTTLQTQNDDDMDANTVEDLEEFRSWTSSPSYHLLSPQQVPNIPNLQQQRDDAMDGNTKDCSLETLVSNSSPCAGSKECLIKSPISWHTLRQCKRLSPSFVRQDGHAKPADSTSTSSELPKAIQQQVGFKLHSPSSEFVRCVARAISPSLSSSPVEMEIAVPYALDDPFTSSGDASVSRDGPPTENIPSTDALQISRLQVVRTPQVGSTLSLQRSLSADRENKMDTAHKSGFQRNKPSSDPVIPVSSESTATKSHNVSASIPSQSHCNDTSVHRSSDDHLASDLKYAVVHSSGFVAPPSTFSDPDNGDYLPKQLHEGIPLREQNDGLFSDVVSSAENPKVPPQLYGIHHMTTPDRCDSFHTIPNVHHTIIPATQIPLEHQLYAGNGSSYLESQQYAVPQVANHALPSQRRMHLNQHVDLDFSQVVPTTINAHELAKANRRKFMQQHSNQMQPFGNEGIMPPLLERFRAAYPEYTASRKQFIKACVYLEWLKYEKKAAPHPSLWDDFIRAFSDEYLNYIRICKASEAKPTSGIEFYNDQIAVPTYTKRIVTTANLNEALSMDSVETERARRPFRRISNHVTKRTSQPVASVESTCNTQDATNELCEESKRSDPFPQLYTYVPHPNDTTAVSSRQITAKKPFFETPSQLIIKAQAVPLETSAQNCESRAASPICPGFINFTKSKPGPSDDGAAGTSPKETSRLLPLLSSQTDALLFSSLKNEIQQHGSMRVSIGPQPQIEMPVTGSKGSPILKAMEIHNSVPIADIRQTDTGSPILGSQFSPLLHRRDSFKAPNLLASKVQARRTHSMPGNRLNSLDTAWQTSENSLSVPTKRKASPMSSSTPKRPAWKDFAKNFISRRRRLSEMTDSLSMPRSTASSPGQERFIIRSSTSNEPETQEWNV